MPNSTTAANIDLSIIKRAFDEIYHQSPWMPETHAAFS
jgi:hypothetical protein